MTTIRIHAALLLASLATGVSAQPAGQGGSERPHGPPPEAVAACSGKASTAVCNFTDREGRQLTGTCFAPPRKGEGKPGGQGDRPLACRPDHGSDGNSRGPERKGG